VKSHTSSAIAKVLIATSFVTICASTGNADPNSLRAQAEAELGPVTVDVDSANIVYSPADNGLGRGFMNVEEYQQQYLAGRESFQEANMSKHCSICTKPTALSVHNLIGPKPSNSAFCKPPPRIARTR
jgi:hypothetical protein